jgi:hypothetical protein
LKNPGKKHRKKKDAARKAHNKCSVRTKTSQRCEALPLGGAEACVETHIAKGEVKNFRAKTCS